MKELFKFLGYTVLSCASLVICPVLPQGRGEGPRGGADVESDDVQIYGPPGKNPPAGRYLW